MPRRSARESIAASRRRVRSFRCPARRSRAAVRPRARACGRCRVELQQPELQRDDPDQREGDQPDPDASADQAVEQPMLGRAPSTAAIRPKARPAAARAGGACGTAGAWPGAASPGRRRAAARAGRERPAGGAGRRGRARAAAAEASSRRLRARRVQLAGGAQSRRGGARVARDLRWRGHDRAAC